MISNSGKTIPSKSTPPLGMVSKPPEPERLRANLDSSFTKWVLPSVTVLVAIVGYVVQSAQQDMLGIGIGPGETTTFFISAAKFLSDTGRLIAAPVISLNLPLGGHWVLVGLSTLGTVAVLLAPRLAATRRLHHAALITVLLATLLLAKFLALDVPLSRVTNVVLGEPEKMELSTGRPLPINRTDGNWSANRADQSAAGIMNSIRCSRINPDLARANAALAGSPECKRGKSYNTSQLIGTYYAQIWMMALIVITACAALRSRSGRLDRMLALLGIIYALSIPYAFGKLISSTFYDYGTVYLTPAPFTGGSPSPQVQSGIILSRGTGGASLLVLQRSDCPSSDPKDPTRSTLVARQWIPQSRIASIEQIYSADVVKWAAGYARACPNYWSKA